MAPMRPQTAETTLDFIPRDMVVRTLGMRRLLNAKQHALGRGLDPEQNAKKFYNRDGSIKERGLFCFNLNNDPRLRKVVGEFDLGKKGGTWIDPTPMSIIRPGREATPPTFIPRMRPEFGSRGQPGRVNKDQYVISVRRLCDKLSRAEQQRLMAEFGGYAYRSDGTMEIREFTPKPVSVEYRDALKGVQRLSADMRQQLFKELHFGSFDNQRATGCGVRHHQRPRSVAFPPAPGDDGFDDLAATHSTLRSTQRSQVLGQTGQTLMETKGSLRSLGSQASRGSRFAREGRASRKAGEWLEKTAKSLGLPVEATSVQPSQRSQRPATGSSMGFGDEKLTLKEALGIPASSRAGNQSTRGFLEQGQRTQWQQPRLKTPDPSLNHALGERLLEEMGKLSEKRGLERPKGVDQPPKMGGVNIPKIDLEARQAIEAVPDPAFC